MSVEWDEELIAGLESGLHVCGSDECQERQRAIRIARAEHAARLEAEAERDALAEKVARLTDFSMRAISNIGPDALWANFRLELYAILSDDQGEGE